MFNWISIFSQKFNHCCNMFAVTVFCEIWARTKVFLHLIFINRDFIAICTDDCSTHQIIRIIDFININIPIINNLFTALPKYIWNTSIFHFQSSSYLVCTNTFFNLSKSFSNTWFLRLKTEIINSG